MHPHAALIERFYDAFGRRDAEAMAACYHDDIVFSDPIFGELEGEEARDMWRMLCERAQGLALDVSGITATEATGGARWVADYRFGKAQRPVRNVIDARFAFREGLIARHDDRFDPVAWARQALGLPGALLGWTPWMQRRIREDARRRLAQWRARRTRAV